MNNHEKIMLRRHLMYAALCYERHVDDLANLMNKDAHIDDALHEAQNLARQRYAALALEARDFALRLTVMIPPSASAATSAPTPAPAPTSTTTPTPPSTPSK